MKTALFISPHLDDVAFSCGATLIELAEKGWRTILCNIFTQSVLNPTGFALACQTDKGLSADVDYMRLRRAEDAEFVKIANVTETLNLLFAEAPHRGYDSAPELFAGIKAGDQIWRGVADELQEIACENQPDLIFAPQGIGNHADHLQTIKAVLASGFAPQTLWYRDTPYAIRNRAAKPSNLLPPDLHERAIPVSAAALERKIAGCAVYATQIGFQFGGASELAASLREFHAAEAARFKTAGFAEALLANPAIHSDLDN